MHLNWKLKDGHGRYYGLFTLMLESVHDAGVYMIWHGGPTSRVVRVGQGIVSDRLANHRRDQQILAYQRHGLYVTWAAVPAAQRDGAERYLANRWQPLVGTAFPSVVPLPVNSPFAA